MNCPQCQSPNTDFAESCDQCGTPMPVLDSMTVQFVDTAALSAGSDFGPRYRIEALLGQGGMGRVYKAFDKQLERTIAIKVVRQGMMNEGDALRRFKQELLLASKISHKNILRIHDMAEVGDVKFITMAYVEGSDLHHILRKENPLPFERVLNFAKQLAAALAAAHAEGVVHRDLKPQNVLVGAGDQLYVSDFGLARSFEEASMAMTRTGVFVGTPRYMSPEQVEGKPVDPSSDVYAYGLMLYEMATGDVPFTGESTVKVMYQRLQERPQNPRTLNPALPEWFARVTMKCLEREPGDRYANADEITADLTQQTGPAVSLAGATRTIQIKVPELAARRSMWALVTGVPVALVLLFAIPQTRHLILRSGATNALATPGSALAPGIPAITQGKFVAILPFHVVGDREALGYVAEGLNEALSAKLFQLNDLRLVSDTGEAKVSESDSLEQAARKLGVNLIVHGSVQGSADKMAIIINLQNMSTRQEVWSGTFSGSTSDLLTMEDKIYAGLVAALALKPTNEEYARTTARPTENTEAYDLYLKGRNTIRGHQDTDSIQTAIGYYNSALQRDPNFALAYAGLSDASLMMYGENKDSFWSQKALAAAQQADRLNDSLPEVHFALGEVYDATGQSADAVTEIQRALTLAPNSDDGYRRLGAAYESSTGKEKEAFAAYEKAIQIDPYFWLNYNSLGAAYIHFGQYDKALQQFDRVIQLEPDNSSGYGNKGSAYFLQGKFDECIPYYQKALQLQPQFRTYSNLGTAFFYLKRYQESVQMFEKAAALNPNDETVLGNLADGYRWAGDKDKANATYEKAIGLAYKQLQVNPQDAVALGDLALYYAKKGDPAQAKVYVHHARSIDPGDIFSIYIEAVVDTLSNHPDDAVKDLKLAFQKGFAVSDVTMDPEFGTLQSRPDFQALLKEFGGTNSGKK